MIDQRVLDDSAGEGCIEGSEAKNMHRIQWDEFSFLTKREGVKPTRIQYYSVKANLSECFFGYTNEFFVDCSMERSLMHGINNPDNCVQIQQCLLITTDFCFPGKFCSKGETLYFFYHYHSVRQTVSNKELRSFYSKTRLSLSVCLFGGVSV